MKKPFVTPFILQFAIPIFATACLSLPALASDPDPVITIEGKDSNGGYAQKTVVVTFASVTNCALVCCPPDPAQTTLKCPALSERTDTFSKQATQSDKFNLTLTKLFHYITGGGLENQKQTVTTTATTNKLPSYDPGSVNKGFQIQLFLQTTKTSYEEHRSDGTQSGVRTENPQTQTIAYVASPSIGLNQTYDPNGFKITPPTADPCP